MPAAAECRASGHIGPQRPTRISLQAAGKTRPGLSFVLLKPNRVLHAPFRNLSLSSAPSLEQGTLELPDRGIGILELGRQRLRARGLKVELQDEYIRHMQGYLRYYNEPHNAKRLAKLDAVSAVEAYLAWLRQQRRTTTRELLLARSAIELLYSEVFRIPINRS
jgi:hypothetical protein